MIIRIVVFYFLLKCLCFAQSPFVTPGFPINIDNERSFSVNSVPLIADLDKDNQKEIITTSYNLSSNNIFYSKLSVIKSNGISFSNFPKEFNDTLFAIACGDINGDSFLDIVIRSNSKIYAIDRFGNNLPGFPVNYYDGQFNIFKSVSLYDLDNDKNLDIIVSQNNQLCVFDNHGNIKPGWPTYFPGIMHLLPAIGDIDNNKKGEIVALTFKQLAIAPYFDSAYIRIYKYNGENFSSNWPIKLDSNYGFWEGSPSIYIDKNNSDSSFIIVPDEKIISASTSEFRTRISKYGIYGNIKNRIVQKIFDYGFGTISIGDIDNSNTLEFFGGAGYGEDNYLFSNQMSVLNGWPYEGDCKFQRIGLMGKIKSDNNLQIVIQTSYQINSQGFIIALTKDGSQLPWSPLRPIGPVISLAMNDLNNDGSVEIVSLSSLRDTMSTVSVWTVPGISFSHVNNPWPMYGHDRYRTNQYGFVPPDETVGIVNNNGKIPDNYSLYQNFPNPFNPATKISYDLPARNHVTLAVYDITGKLIETLANENQPAGSYEYYFDGSKLSSGIYIYKLHSDNFTETKKMILIK